MVNLCAPHDSQRGCFPSFFACLIVARATMEHCSRGQGFFGKSSFPTTNSLVYVSVLRGGYKHYNNRQQLYPNFYFTTIGAAVDTGESVALNRAPVRERTVAFVLLKPVLRVLGGKPLHQPVARHLGHDRGEGDDRHAEVALNDSALDIFLGRAQ